MLRISRRKVLTGLSAIGLTGATGKQSQTIEALRAKGNLPALAALVITDGQVSESQVAGFRKVGNAAPASINDKFHLGSCTKAMTAMLIGILVDQNKLSWQSKLPDVFPKLKMDPAFDAITLDLLLNQTSGLSSESWPKTHSFLGWHTMKGTPRERRLAYLEDTLRVAPNKPVGSKFEYSNTNYALLGIVAEAVADLSYEELIKREIFDKIGMASAGFGHPADPAKVDPPDQPWPHKLENGRASAITPGPTSDNPDVLTPAGRVHCNIHDWAKFIALELKHIRGEGGLLSRQTSDHLHAAPPHGDYMGGWIITERPWAGGTAFTHAGSNTVNFCVAWLAPKKNFATLAMTNVGGDDVFPTLDAVVAASIRKWL